jgi:hypothetical protein
MTSNEWWNILKERLMVGSIAMSHAGALGAKSSRAAFDDGPTATNPYGHFSSGRKRVG